MMLFCEPRLLIIVPTYVQWSFSYPNPNVRLEPIMLKDFPIMLLRIFYLLCLHYGFAFVTFSMQNTLSRPSYDNKVNQ